MSETQATYKTKKPMEVEQLKASTPNVGYTSFSILDVCCGSKMFWFNKNYSGAIYGDIRSEKHVLCDGRNLEINPDILFNFCALPFRDKTFNLVVFDPPHLKQLGKSSWMAKKYGVLFPTWETDIAQGFSECMRVLRPNGTLIFKWNESQITVNDILKNIEFKPLFGHTTGRQSKTMWLTFLKDV